MSARLDGEKRVNKSLDRHAKQVERQTTEALKSGGMIIKNDAWEKAPYKTGNLRSSLNVEVESSVNEKSVIIGTDVSYAPHLEYGTSKMKARPFLRPAFDAKKEEAIKEIKNALNALAKKWNR